MHYGWRLEHGAWTELCCIIGWIWDGVVDGLLSKEYQLELNLSSIYQSELR